ncbi:hypothetical protein [Engelhardtia mirabilis]|uniref:hypothetical protein n=1 Tax=Engelhardtia mirabilis TaxID=2528011 RepID=UPI003AF3BFA8
MNRSLLLAAVALAAASQAAQAQSFSQLAPPVGIPGDTIVVHGSNLDSVTAVRFNAVVGGFVGQAAMDAPATVIDSNTLLVDVPLFNSFAPPTAIPPGSVDGFLQLLTPGGLTGNQIVFTFLEATQGQIVTYGQGGSEAGAFDPRIGFRLQFGLPVAGNPSFDARAFDLPPGSAPFLFIGLPGTSPYPPFAGGELLLDAAGPVIVVPGAIPATQTIGETFVQIAIPPSAAGATVGLQWIAIDGSNFTLAITNALQATL